MEVKVNKDINEYTEAIFFGLSLRQCVFSVLAVLVAVGDAELALYRWCSSVCGHGICEVPRHERGTASGHLVSYRDSGAEGAHISGKELLL